MELTPQQKADELARQAAAKKKESPEARFRSKATFDKATGKWTDNATGKEVSPPPGFPVESDDKPGTLGGRPVPPA